MMRLYQRKLPSGKVVWCVAFNRNRRISLGLEVGKDDNDAKASEIFKEAMEKALAARLDKIRSEVGLYSPPLMTFKDACLYFKVPPGRLAMMITEGQVEAFVRKPSLD